jgi:hypothetical protein
VSLRSEAGSHSDLTDPEVELDGIVYLLPILPVLPRWLHDRTGPANGRQCSIGWLLDDEDDGRQGDGEGERQEWKPVLGRWQLKPAAYSL